MRSYSCCDSSTETSKDLQSLSSLLKLVGEESRLRLLCILKDGGEHCVCELIEHADDLSQSLISHHLADLKNADLVSSKKIGLRAYYTLTDEGLHIVKTIFKLTNKENKMNDQKNKDCGCGSTSSTDTGTGTDDTSVATAAVTKTDDKCCGSGKCGKDCKKGDSDENNENRSCGNGMCDVSAAAQNNAACC